MAEAAIWGKQKKGASKSVTRLPTERLATACWAFIVAKTIGLEPAPLLRSGELRRSDKSRLSTGCPHRAVVIGYSDSPRFYSEKDLKSLLKQQIANPAKKNQSSTAK